MRKHICAISVFIGIILCMNVCSVNADRLWEYPYMDIVNRYCSEGAGYYQLADLDVDGVPELVIGNEMSSSRLSNFKYGYTIKNGKLISFDEEKNNLILSWDGYHLYYNRGKNQVRIKGSNYIYSGENNYSIIECVYMLDEKLHCVENFILKNENGNKRYFIRDYSMEVDSETYLTTWNDYYAEWEKMDDYVSVHASFPQNASEEQIKNFFDSYSEGPAIARSSEHNMKLDGVPFSIDAYTIAGNNYFKLRDIAALLNGSASQFEVLWNEQYRTVGVYTGNPYTPVGGELVTNDISAGTIAKPNKFPVYVDDNIKNAAAYNINDNTYFKLRDLGNAIGFNVKWDETTRTVNITTS